MNEWIIRRNIAAIERMLQDQAFAGRKTELRRQLAEQTGMLAALRKPASER
ncbi:MAG: hypothetical protein P4L73_02130 [Caulobacteraceae bacterium]|nr:hypothetical protein [Caulobacteraceae bacterium]